MHTDLNLTPLLAAGGGIEVLVALIIIGITSLVNWLKRRNQADDWTKETTPRQQAPPKRANWEEELRRMLDVEEPTPSTPPPVIREQRPAAPPPPVPQVAPPVQAKPFAEVKTYRGHCEHCGGHIEFPSNLTGDSIICPHCYEQTVLAPFRETAVEQLMHRPELTTFKESVLARQRAEGLDEMIAARLGAASRTPVQQTHAELHRHKSPEVEKVISLLRSPQTARQAIVASIILGPPKALET